MQISDKTLSKREKRLKFCGEDSSESPSPLGIITGLPSFPPTHIEKVRVKSAKQSRQYGLKELVSLLIEEFNCNAETLDIYKRETEK